MFGMAALALLALGGCATSGTGEGAFGHSGAGAVKFHWRSSDAISGTMSATLPDGTAYSGPFFRISEQIQTQRLAPLWWGWDDGWLNWDWDYYYGAPSSTFITRYTGRVVANLTDASGDHMRCRFRLVRPAQGMSGGGQGQCQLAGSKEIQAIFSPA
jgi:hypothetical protein